MKKIVLALLLASAAVPAMAADVSAPFNVTVNLSSVCELTTPDDVAFVYTSLQVGASTATGGGFDVTCTNSLPYQIGFTNAATPAATAAGTFATVNLAYTLGLSATSGVGSGVAQSNTITGSMVAGQAGTCASASCTDTMVQTLYVVY
ncbi:hypothetical protein [Piscinibacter sp.]|uniref:hypothetical protein n=1 Tax=Piscinibacter sp. TaxID=1903157 RepID=UPI002C9F6D79|nr:hypothetical protein [Albitalea sp.]HUG24714.1 hypothetical protein [Albitalea sp.]